MSANDSFLGKIFQVGKAVWDSTDPNKRETESLNQFIATVKTKGVAKTNAFITTIPMPHCLTVSANERYKDGQLSEVKNYLAIMCNTASLPGISFDTSRLSMNGGHIEVPYDTSYDSVTLSFYVDSSMRLKFLFDNWMDSIRLQSTKGFEFYKNFITDIDIDIVDTDKNKVYSVRLLEAYPKSVQGVNLSWKNSNEVMELQVSFVYKSYITTSIDGTPKREKSLLDTLFGGQGWYEGGKSVVSAIGSVVSTVDEYTGRFERLRGIGQGYRDQFKGIKGILNSKTERIKDLGKWL